MPAAPAPCTARATISISGVTAAAEAAEATANTAQPPRNTRLVPTRRAHAASGSDMAVKVTRYATTMACICTPDASSEVRTRGMATLSTDASNDTST